MDCPAGVVKAVVDVWLWLGRRSPVCLCGLLPFPRSSSSYNCYTAAAYQFYLQRMEATAEEAWKVVGWCRDGPRPGSGQHDFGAADNDMRIGVRRKRQNNLVRISQCDKAVFKPCSHAVRQGRVTEYVCWCSAHILRYSVESLRSVSIGTCPLRLSGQDQGRTGRAEVMHHTICPRHVLVE